MSATLLPWDTDFWGVRVGRATSSSARLAHAVARAEQFDCLYLLVPIDEMAEAHEAVELGFRLVDVRVEFEIPVEPVPAPFLGERVRPAQSADLPALELIAVSSFRRTRFYNDPRFPDDACDRLYGTWTRNAFRDATVLVAEREGRVCGYVTLDGGEVGLIAVAAHARRQGVGHDLMLAALNWAMLEDLRTLSVVTQGGNTGAQRLFQSVGGRTSSVGLWFHKHYER